MVEVQKNLPCLFLQSGFQYLWTEIWSRCSALVARMAAVISYRNKTAEVVRVPVWWRILSSLLGCLCIWQTLRKLVEQTSQAHHWHNTLARPWASSNCSKHCRHSCSLTQDPRHAFLFPGAQRFSAWWQGDGFTGEHCVTSDWMDADLSPAPLTAPKSVSPSLPPNPHTLGRPWNPFSLGDLSYQLTRIEALQVKSWF